MNNLQDQGRACYKRGDYKKAIELFDRAIGRSPSVQLLDNRAACYEKLNDYSTGLKDAKKAIQLHREDAIGYLRAGRLLVKMEKPGVALEIYTFGLKSIKHVGQGHEQLRKVHKELMNELCPPKSVDPLTVLPRELAETILEYLSFRQRMNACIVSKQWTLFIRSVPNLWRHLDLSGARRKVRTAFISRAINIARAKLRVATLSNLYDFDKTLSALLKHCPIEELTLLECGLQGHNLTSRLVSTKDLKSLRIMSGTQVRSVELPLLVKALSYRLQSLECSVTGPPPAGRFQAGPTSLTSLSLTLEDISLAALFPRLSDTFPALQTLRVIQPSGGLGSLDLRACHQLKSLDLGKTCAMLHVLQIPPTVTTLSLNVGFSPRMQPYDLPSLKELTVIGGQQWQDVENLLKTDSIPTIPDQGHDTAPSPSTLCKLSYIAGYWETTGEVRSLLCHPRLKDLTHLGFADCVGFDDRVVEAIVSAKLKTLRTVDFSGTDVTGVGVKQVVSSLNPDTLILNECRNLSSDAVDWARSKGLSVKYRMTSNASAGGRKVRY